MLLDYPVHMTPPKARTLLLALLASLSLCACRSAFVETTIENNGSTPIHLIEVDYPSASFGTQSLDAHASYHYHFKIQGSGSITLTYTGSDGKIHTVTGPVLSEGQQGDLRVVIDASGGVRWIENLSSRH
jgi:hypothetical protein